MVTTEEDPPPTLYPLLPVSAHMPETEKGEHPDRPPLQYPLCLSKRLTQALLIATGLMVSHGLRCNVGPSIVTMMSSDDDNIHEGRDIQWIERVDSSFFHGYILTQIPAGFLAAKFPPNKMLGAAIFLSSCLNLLLPTANKLEPDFVIVVRFLQGLVEGVTYPCMMAIWRWWAPPLERSKLVTLSLMGPHAGIVLGMPLSGYLVDWVGWYAPYYVFGLCGVVWYCFWLWLSFEKPSLHPSISPEEQSYIEDSLGDSNPSAQSVLGRSWWRMLISLPVYSIIMASFAWSWTYHLSMTFPPKYFKEKYDMSYASWSMVSISPGLQNIVLMISVPIGGQLTDILRRRGIVTTTTVRKILTCAGFGIQALFLLAMLFSNTWLPAAISLLLSVISCGFTVSGFLVNHLDIAPRYASILMGMSHSAATLAGLVCPIVTRTLTETASGPLQITEQWQYVIGIAIGIHCTASILYAIFASGELQKWAVGTSQHGGKQGH